MLCVSSFQMSVWPLLLFLTFLDVYVYLVCTYIHVQYLILCSRRLVFVFLEIFLHKQFMIMPMDNVLFKCPVLNTATENATQIDFLSVPRYFLNIYFLTFVKWLLYCFRFVPGKHFCFLSFFLLCVQIPFFSQINFNWRPLKIEAQSKINTILIICIPLPVSLSIGIAILYAFFF